MSFDDDLRTSWAANAARWTDLVQSGGIDSRVRVTDAAIIAAALARSPRTVLDLGCGEGWLCRVLTAAGIAEVTGVDTTDALIDAACRSPGHYLRIDYADIIRDPARIGEGFDLVIANFALLDADVGPLLAALAHIAAPDGRLVIQTLHPMNGDGPYADGWRTETFAGLSGEGESTSWTPMPWYFRTLTSWLACLAPAWTLTAMAEPLHPDTQRPASLILEATVAAKRD